MALYHELRIAIADNELRGVELNATSAIKQTRMRYLAWGVLEAIFWCLMLSVPFLLLGQWVWVFASMIVILTALQRLLGLGFGLSGLLYHYRFREIQASKVRLKIAMISHFSHDC